MVLQSMRGLVRAFGPARCGAAMRQIQPGVASFAATRAFSSAQASPLPNWDKSNASPNKPAAVPTYNRGDIDARIDHFHDTVLATNWADYLILVYDVPFWEAELDEIQT